MKTERGLFAVIFVESTHFSQSKNFILDGIQLWKMPTSDQIEFVARYLMDIYMCLSFDIYPNDGVMLVRIGWKI